jgi:oligosaccharide translocation protein RFT1
MTIFSMIYISAALILYSFHLGDVSLVYANIINLSARISYSLYFISTWFGSRGVGDLLRWRDVVPRWEIVLVSASSAALIWYSDRRVEIIGKGERLALYPSVGHIALGAALALACLGTWWTCSGRFLTLPVHAKSE